MTMQEWIDSVKIRAPRLFAQLGQPEIVRYPKTSRWQIPQVEVKFPGVAQHLVFDMEIGAEERATLREKERIYLKYNSEIERLRVQMEKEIAAVGTRRAVGKRRKEAEDEEAEAKRQIDAALGKPVSLEKEEVKP